MANNRTKINVDISELFKWKGEAEIKDNKGNVVATVYIKLVGDRDYEVARRNALKESSQVRRNIRDGNSPEYESIIQTMNDLNKEAVISTVIGSNLADIRHEAEKALVIKEPTKPKDDSLEEVERYETEKDNFPIKYDESIRKELDKIMDKERTRLGNLPLEELEKEFIRAVANKLCEQNFVKAFYDNLIYMSTYQDSDFSKRAFKNYDTYLSSTKEVKEQLLAAYSKVELNQQELKN